MNISCTADGRSYENLCGRISQLETELRYWQNVAHENYLRCRAFEEKTSDIIDNHDTSFVIKVCMSNRWIPHFLAMLKCIEHNGNVGHSSIVGIYADGDGDFRPNFIWSNELSSDVLPVKTDRGTVIYDAG